jgi:sigma-B regulation protein RsbU (phosphoserine phosphatase)
MAASPARRARASAERLPEIGSLALFRGTDQRAVASALRDCEVRTLPAGAVLLTPGEANDTIFVLLFGDLAAYPGGKAHPEAAIRIEPGQSVGEMSVIDGKPVSALVVAMTEARVLCLPSDVFWRRLSPVPGVFRNLLASLSERMRHSNESMLEAQRKRLELEHLEQELGVARQLQASMIPVRGRLFPERDDIEIAGIMEPASAVGGDFFDAFFVDDTHLFICVGDVSGHGIPAALFMARAIGLIRIAAMSTRKPERVLQRVNEQMCIGNEASVFVTLFVGFLDVASGRLVHANGGHCPPVLVHAGKASMLPIAKGTLVGAIPGLRYTSTETLLERGATLVCFTDGITEAESTSGSEFSEERLLSVSAANCGESIECLLGVLRGELASFMEHRVPADDCTLLAVRRPR